MKSPGADKNVLMQPGESHYCTHLMNISLIITHRPSTRYHRHLWTPTELQCVPYFDVVTLSLSSAWCACVPLMMPLHVPLSGQDPPSHSMWTPGVKSEIHHRYSNGNWFSKSGFKKYGRFHIVDVSFANCSTTSDIKDLL